MSDRDRVGEIRAGTTIRRRRVLALGAGAFGASLAMPAVWERVFGAAKPYKIGSEQPMTGVAALGGKTAVVGLQMAIDRINKAGGIFGRPLELIVADDQSKPDTGRRAVQKLVTQDEIDAHVGGFLSNICLACEPVFSEYKVVNMISVCLDTTLTTTHCNKYTFRPYDFAPAQAKAFAPFLVNKLGKRWFITYADYAWGQATRDAYASEIKKNGGAVAGTMGIPLGTPDMTPFLSKINGDFDGLFMIFFGPDAIHIINQGYDLGLHKKYKWAGDGAVAVGAQLPAMGNKIDGFYGIDRYVPVFKPKVLDTPYLHAFYNDAVARLKKAGVENGLPDRYVDSNYEAMNCLAQGIRKSKFHGRDDTPKLIAALEGMRMKEGYDFPTGDKLLRKADHQAFTRELIYEMKGGTYDVVDTIPWQKTVVPPDCTFSA